MIVATQRRVDIAKGGTTMNPDDISMMIMLERQRQVERANRDAWKYQGVSVPRSRLSKRFRSRKS